MIPHSGTETSEQRNERRTENNERRTENNEQGAGRQEPGTGRRELRTSGWQANDGRRWSADDGSTADNGRRVTDGGALADREDTLVEDGEMDGRLPVPIVDVGTWVTTRSGKQGIVQDAVDREGTLLYLVQFEQHVAGQFIPARALKGVWI